MAGPMSPDSDGPSFAPPPLPAGWIAQWDASSRKYYFVQLSTGVSQWDVPTKAAPVGGTPTPSYGESEHPFGAPSSGSNVGTNGASSTYTHPDGSQTIQHPDGRLEPVMPSEDGTRRVPNRAFRSEERSLGSFASSLLQSQLSGQHGNSSQSGANPLGQLISGLSHSNSGSTGQHSGSNSSTSSGIGSKLVGQLASNLFSPGNKPTQSQTYHQGTSGQASHTSGGLANAVMGGVAGMFGGHQQQQDQNYGYTGSGLSGTYSGAPPPTAYQPLSQPTYSSQGAPSSGVPGTSAPSASSYQHTSAATSYALPPTAGQSSQYASYGQSQQPQQHQQHLQHPQQPTYSSPSSPSYGSPAQDQAAAYGGTPTYFPPPPGQQQHQQQHQQSPLQYGHTQHYGGSQLSSYGSSAPQASYNQSGYGSQPRY